MPYTAFLTVMSQLASKRKARIVFQGDVIDFESSKETLTFSTQVYVAEEQLPPSVRSCTGSCGNLRWQKGAHLKIEQNRVLLIQEIDLEKGKYIPFKLHLSEFSIVAAEWREILQEIDERESSRF